MKNAVTIALAVIATLLLLKQCSSSPVTIKEVTKSDTVTIIEIDTVVVEKPGPVRIVERRTDTITVYQDGDTVLVPVPISQYHFQKDSLYSLDVSGFNVSVDRLEVYPRTIYRTVNTTTDRTVSTRKRFGIGIQAGYGINLATGKFSPYIGIGVQYSVWRF